MKLLTFCSVIYFLIATHSLFVGNFDLAFWSIGAAGLTAALLTFNQQLNES